MHVCIETENHVTLFSWSTRLVHELQARVLRQQ